LGTYRFPDLLDGGGDCFIDQRLDRRARLGSVGHLHIRCLFQLLLSSELGLGSHFPCLNKSDGPKGEGDTVNPNLSITGFNCGGDFPTGQCGFTVFFAIGEDGDLRGGKEELVAMIEVGLDSVVELGGG